MVIRIEPEITLLQRREMKKGREEKEGFQIEDCELQIGRAHV